MKRYFPQNFFFLLVLLLGGCAGEMAYRDGKSLIAMGKTDEGLARLEEATRQAPDNLEFRYQYQNAKEMVANRLIRSAQTEFRANRYESAEALFQKARMIDPENSQIDSYTASIDRGRRIDALIAEIPKLLESNQLEMADQMISRVLIEDPRNEIATSFQRVLNEKGGRSKVVSPTLNKIYKKRITLELREANLKQLVEVMSQNSGLNFILDKDIPPNLNATIFLRDVSIEDALDVILKTHQLEKRVLNDTTLLVFPNTSAKLAEHQELVVRSFFLANSNAKQVMEMLKTVLKVKNVYVDEKLNLLVIRDTPDGVRLAEQLVSQQDIPEPEVMLEVEVLEIKRSSLTQLGIQFPDQLTLTPLASNGTTVTLADIRSANSSRTGAALANTVINAHRDTDDSTVLANPRIRTRNHEKAEIKIGDRLPVVTTTTVSTGFVSENVQYVDVGLKLDVEPSIYPDNQIEIKMSLEVSSVVGNVTSKAGSTYYKIGGRNASTVLRLKDGETQVLGGLIDRQVDNSANLIPGLGDLPLLGRLFGSHRDNSQKTELVLSITPRLIRSIVPPQGVPREFWSGTENSLRMRMLSPASALKSATTSANSPLPDPTTPALTLPLETSGVAEVETISGLSRESSKTAKPAEISWGGTSPVKVGGTINAKVMITSDSALTGLPLQIKYDPKVIEIVEAKAGSFLSNDGTNVKFSQNNQRAAGLLFVTQNRAGETGTAGHGEVLELRIKALKPAEASVMTVLPTSPIGAANMAVTPTHPAMLSISITP